MENCNLSKIEAIGSAQESSQSSQQSWIHHFKFHKQSRCAKVIGASLSYWSLPNRINKVTYNCEELILTAQSNPLTRHIIFLTHVLKLNRNLYHIRYVVSLFLIRRLYLTCTLMASTDTNMGCDEIAPCYAQSVKTPFVGSIQ